MTKDERTALRETLLAQQDGECAICHQRQATAKGLCHIPFRAALICRACSTFLCAFQERASVGVGVSDLTTFLRRSIIAVEPEPTESAPESVHQLMIGGVPCELVDGEWISVDKSE
ncbi:hypothetical protein LCGC14_0542430 [marine sediment metagenome]|uniref:Uncharacterized protein n=1 Tax=marine sediment metagenome TaxID=412755 RepID=A0A0F9V0M3_9ZZZZ